MKSLGDLKFQQEKNNHTIIQVKTMFDRLSIQLRNLNEFDTNPNFTDIDSQILQMNKYSHHRNEKYSKKSDMNVPFSYSKINKSPMIDSLKKNIF